MAAQVMRCWFKDEHHFTQYLRLGVMSHNNHSGQTLSQRKGGTKCKATGLSQHHFEPLKRHTHFGSSMEQLFLCFGIPCVSCRWQTPASLLEPEKSLELCWLLVLGWDWEQMCETHPLKVRLNIIKLVKQANSTMPAYYSSPFFSRVACQHGCCSLL